MTKNKSADTPDEIVTTVRLTRDQHKRMLEIAAAEHRTFSGEIRRLVELRIAEYDAPTLEAAA